VADIHVETLTIPDTGVFVIGRNFVGDALSEPGAELEWTDIACEAKSIHIERGGKRTGVATTLDVGTLSVTTVNAWSPADEPTIKPNTPIRVWTPARVWPVEGTYIVPSGDIIIRSDWFNGLADLDGYEVASPGSGRSLTVGTDPWGGAALIADKGTSFGLGVKKSFLGHQGPITFRIVARSFGPPEAGGSVNQIRIENPAGGTTYESSGALNFSQTEYTEYVISHDFETPTDIALYIGQYSSFGIRSISVERPGPPEERQLVPQVIQEWDWGGDGETAPWEVTHLNDGVVEEDPWATGTAFVVSRLAHTSAYPISSPSFVLPAGSGSFSAELRTFDPNGSESGYGYVTLHNAGDDSEIASAYWGDGDRDSEYGIVMGGYGLAERTEVYLRIQATNRSVAIRNSSITSDGILYQDTRLYTGNIEDVQVDFSRKGDTFVTITAADAVKQHNNTQRYGAVVEGGVGYETWANRIRRLVASSTADVNPPGPESDQDREIYRYNPYRPGSDAKDGWATFGTLSGGTLTNYGYLGWYRSSSANISITPGSTGIRRTITGLVTGRRYRVSVGLAADSQIPFSGFDTWAVGVTGKSWSEPVQQKVGQVFPMNYEFVATATSHQVNIALYQTASYDAPGSTYYIRAFFRDIKVVEVVADAIVLQDVVYESSLANHFDMACNSVGGAWWVDEENVTQFALTLPNTDPIIARFSDVHEDGPWPEGTPPHVCYTDVQVGYDTTNVVNDLAVVNHGRDAVTGDAADVTYGVRDITSSANWGARQATIDTSIKNDSIFAGSVDTVAGWILESSKDPALAVTSVTFNAGDFPAVQIGLDVQSRVLVTRNGVDYPCRVVAITHDIEASTGRWFTTLALTKENSNG
jgi:hypothetical protein